MLKSREITLPIKICLVKAMVFPVVRYGYELNYKESWGQKNWCFWTVVLEKTLENPFDCKEIQSVHPKGDQSWVFIGRTDAEAETPGLWPPDAKSWLIWKDPDAGKDWGQEENGMTEDEMVGWHRWLNGHGFGWTRAVGDRQGGLACCDSRGPKSRTRLNDWTELNRIYLRLGFPGGAVVKNPHANAGDASSDLGLGRSPGEGNGNSLQYSCLENPMDREAWWATVHRVAKSWTWLSNWAGTHLRWLLLSYLSEIYLSSDSFPCSPVQWQLLASAGPKPARELSFFFFQTDFQMCVFF